MGGAAPDLMGRAVQLLLSSIETVLVGVVRSCPVQTTAEWSIGN